MTDLAQKAAEIRLSQSAFLRALTPTNDDPPDIAQEELWARGDAYLERMGWPNPGFSKRFEEGLLAKALKAAKA